MRAKAFVFVGTCLMAGQAFALSCVEPQPLMNEVFFQGTVLDASVKRQATPGVQADCMHRYRIHVDKAWHGVKEGEEVTATQAVWLCMGEEPAYKKGDKVNIATNKQLSAGICEGLFFDPEQDKQAFEKRIQELKAR